MHLYKSYNYDIKLHSDFFDKNHMILIVWKLKNKRLLETNTNSLVKLYIDDHFEEDQTSIKDL